jgi:hypothetical protein
MRRANLKISPETLFRLNAARAYLRWAGRRSLTVDEHINHLLDVWEALHPDGQDYARLSAPSGQGASDAEA